MKRLYASTVFILALASLAQASQVEWLKLAPVGGGFTVMMPDKPKEATRLDDDFVIHIFTVDAADGFYIASYGDYAPSIRIDATSQLIDNRDSFLKSLNANLTESKKVEMDGRPGLEFAGESNQAIIRSRIYLFGNRVYQVAVAITNGHTDTANAQRFFASFTFKTSDSDRKP